MVEIIWTEPALNDLDVIADYIALDKPQVASDLVSRVFSHVDKLAEYPELGPVIPELRANFRYRQLVETPCRVFYRFDKSTEKIYILGVMRGEKLFQQRLLQGRDPVGQGR